MATRQALHFVFKIANRGKTMDFYRRVLGMKVLRHEEFEQGCEATCNGPYDGKWSKTMIGYGPEDTHFVIELTYNYGVGAYQHGNDFLGVTLSESGGPARIASLGTGTVHDGSVSLPDPDGYLFTVKDGEAGADPIKRITLASSDLARSTAFWKDVCGLPLLSSRDISAVFQFSPHQCALELRQVSEPIDRGTAFGRIAFACPATELPAIEKLGQASTGSVLTPLTALPTPGKATVEVVILADPDGHEICFVGAEAFSELSQVDPKADQLLNEAMGSDTSEEWFKQWRGGKSTA